MVGEPVATDQQEGQEEAEELRRLFPERVQHHLRRFPGRRELRRVDRDDQQRHRDREDRIGEERHPVEFEPLAPHVPPP